MQAQVFFTVIFVGEDGTVLSDKAPLEISTSSIFTTFSSLLELKRKICNERGIDVQYARLLTIEPINFNNGYIAIHYASTGVFVVPEKPFSKELVGTPVQIPSTIVCQITAIPRQYYYEGDLENVKTVTYY